MSGGHLPYHLRQNKAVDRQLFVDLLARIARITPMPAYTYVGMGGPFLEDFRALHALEFGRMVSFEGNRSVYKRQAFNLPFSNLELVQATSADFFARFDMKSPVVLWLDYTSNRIEDQLGEVERALLKLVHGDVLKVTLNANPTFLCKTLDAGRDDMLEKRRAKLQELVTEDLPVDVTTEMFNESTFPRALVRLVRQVAARVHQSRPDIVIRSLSCFSYADSETQMFTVTCVVLDRSKEAEFFDRTELKTWSHYVDDWGDPRPIRIPALSVRERLWLDSRLPGCSPDTLAANLGYQIADGPSASLAMLNNYMTYQRYLPYYTYTRVLV